MSENVQGESAPASSSSSSQAVDAAAPQCESPPPAAQPAREAASDPRGQLLQLAQKVMRSPDRRLVIEYLRLRRAIA